MRISELFWMLLLLAVAWPFLQQRFLTSSRRRLIRRIETARGSRVILLVHRQESMQVFGVPVYRYLDVDDAERILRAIHRTEPEAPIDLVLHTPGGLVLPALQIARALHRRPGKVSVFVPHYAMSGGTLIALAADELVMMPEAALGSVDPQLDDYPAVSVLRVAAEKPIGEVEDHTLILADQAERALVEMRDSVLEMLKDKYDEDTAEELATLLTGGAWSHDFPLGAEEARHLGLKVRTDLPEEILHLMDLFPQPVRRRPSVEYLPRPVPVPRKRGVG